MQNWCLTLLVLAVPHLPTHLLWRRQDLAKLYLDSHSCFSRSQNQSISLAGFIARRMNNPDKIGIAAICSARQYRSFRLDCLPRQKLLLANRRQFFKALPGTSGFTNS